MNVTERTPNFTRFETSDYGAAVRATRGFDDQGAYAEIEVRNQVVTASDALEMASFFVTLSMYLERNMPFDQNITTSLREIEGLAQSVS